jgi:hypothetical protein
MNEERTGKFTSLIPGIMVSNTSEKYIITQPLFEIKLILGTIFKRNEIQVERRLEL